MHAIVKLSGGKIFALLSASYCGRLILAHLFSSAGEVNSHCAGDGFQSQGLHNDYEAKQVVLSFSATTPHAFRSRAYAGAT